MTSNGQLEKKDKIKGTGLLILVLLLVFTGIRVSGSKDTLGILVCGGLIGGGVGLLIYVYTYHYFRPMMYSIANDILKKRQETE